LASFCRQKYPKYEIIFGVQSWEDPSIEVIEKIIIDFPNLDVKYVVSDSLIGTNRKISNLAQALTRARFDILVLADSDVSVGSNCLQQVIKPLIHPQVGVVTCLYRSLTTGWVATLEALSTSTEFHPGVLVSGELEGIKFAMGQTIVMRRSVLKAIGSFEAIADYLADDYQLGYLPTRIGYKVALSDYLVDHVVPTSTLKQAIQRQVRWMRGIRASRPWGYVGLIFTYGSVTSLLFLCLSAGSALGWFLFGITWITRLLMAWLIGVKYLKDPVAQRFWWQIPIRDFISFALWCQGFFGNIIEWRGSRFQLQKSGILVASASSLF
jgi:ceramide glucosyltransferase